MSDSILSQDEINQLLAGNNIGSKNDVLTQDEINQLIKSILAGDPTEFSAEIIRKLELAKQNSDAFYKRETAILTQDEINQLLTAIDKR
jgi:flagellar motor switch protein FliM